MMSFECGSMFSILVILTGVNAFVKTESFRLCGLIFSTLVLNTFQFIFVSC